MNIPEMFGSNVFNQQVMQELLPKETFKALKRTLEHGESLQIEVANQVAHAMKEWAISKGATHYTHWFQPLTGVTAEKHDSFISPCSDGSVIMEFSGKELVKGEPDASSFPNGGRRATFEARGYTVWDPTSYPFIKEHSLCIPTAFCAYTGEALDKKTPLLRSMESLNEQALRILKLFGSSAVHVSTTMGPEQEYFLVDEDLYLKRKDLVMTGRTLFGAKPAKGQELDDQYFAAIKPRIVSFMAELNEELWKLGIYAKTEHNEAAPAQHEMAPIFTTSNIASDQNQLTMEIMKKVARKHKMVCLLHEKPFAGVNGSGKHNNWSLCTNEGENLFSPGKTPRENAQFLLFIAAVLKAVDENQDLLRITVASASNDHRLGGFEAPPAIMSIYLGDELEAVLKSIKDGTPYKSDSNQKMNIGVDVLPAIPKDSTDRNRTSPFAFTGNRFEFRSVGSSLSISGPNTTLNSILAYSLKQFADELEKASDFESELKNLIKREITAHWRIVFDGNGYAQDWIKEAEKRGLLNLKNLPEAMSHYLDKKNIDLYTTLGVYSQIEMQSHYDIKLEKYSRTINIEVEIMTEMIYKQILPSTFKYMESLAESVKNIITVCPDLDCSSQKDLLKTLNLLANNLKTKTEELSKIHLETKELSDNMKIATIYAQKILPKMAEVRAVADQIEPLLSEECKPFPNYEDLLFSI